MPFVVAWKGWGMTERALLQGERELAGEMMVDLDTVANSKEALRGRAFAALLADRPRQFLNWTG